MLKRTKIVATLGPATDDQTIMLNLLKAGVDMVRLNFSHGTHDAHKKRIEMVRECAKKLHKEVGVLADLQGPKIRVAKFKDGKVMLQSQAKFILDAALAADVGTEEMVGIDYKDLPNDVKAGDTLLLDDGRIVLTVQEVKETRIITTVKVGGILSNNKGINRQGGGLSAAALTDKDKADLIYAVSMNVNYIAVSFPRSALDIIEARNLLKEAGGDAGIIAKIERTESVINIDEIIQASDAIMVARGDLAVEIGDEEVPAVQKLIIQRARAHNKPVITATQMMESMIENPIPTRAEVSDVANAVLDLTDAVMLSAETATGKYPVQVVESMARVCVAAEKLPSTQKHEPRNNGKYNRVDEAIAMATVFTANQMDIKAIICLTESGSTPLMMSRINTGIPIYGFSRYEATRGKMTLYRDVYPISFDVMKLKRWEVNRDAVSELHRLGFVSDGDLVILTKGDHMGMHGGTNAMKILKVGKVE